MIEYACWRCIFCGVGLEDGEFGMFDGVLWFIRLFFQLDLGWKKMFIRSIIDDELLKIMFSKCIKYLVIKFELELYILI